MAADIQGILLPSSFPTIPMLILQSLQLLEYLVKNGSERVIDDARQHISLLRMLRQFHYIDQNGKDQGVNVRNRAQELAKLLSDVDAIRGERKKARANRNKYGGVEGGMTMGGLSGSSRYGGFGSEDAGYGGYRGEVYGDGGGFGGNTSGFQDTQRRSDKFEEYDEDEEDGGSPAAKPSASSHTRASSGLRAASLNTIKRDAKIKKEPEQDLFDFGDEPATTSSNGKAIMSSPKAVDDFGAMESGTTGDEDFDDFQSATTPGLATETQRTAFSDLTPPPPAATSTITSATPLAAPQPVAPAQTSNLNDLFSTISPNTSSSKGTATPAPSVTMTPSITSPSTSQTPKPAFTSTGPNYYTSVQSTINNPASSTKSPFSSTISPNQSFPGMGPKQTSFSSTTTTTSLGNPASKPSSTSAGGGGADAFTSLWSTASGKAGLQSKSAIGGGSANKGQDLASLAKAKNEAAMWGTNTANTTNTGSSSVLARPSAPRPRTAGQGQSLDGGLDDLLG